MRLAATVMLLRPASVGFTVFMLRRSDASHFVPNAYVFPGGTLDEGDKSDRALARTFFESTAPAFSIGTAPGLDDVPRASPREIAALHFTALRELFEETGVLLARNSRGDTARAKAASSRTDFLECLEARNLYADAAALTLFSQWLTPQRFAKRYNTHFFLARAADDVVAAADAVETHDGMWIAPADALERHAGGALQLVYPTRKHLERLASFSSVNSLLEYAKSKRILAITPNADAKGDDFILPTELEGAW